MFDYDKPRRKPTTLVVGVCQNGPIEVADTVNVRAMESFLFLGKNSDVNVKYGEHFALKVDDIIQEWIYLKDPLNVFDLRIATRTPWEKGFHFIIFSKSPKIVQTPTTPIKVDYLKNFLYGRQIEQENKSLPPKNERPFEFL